MTGNLPDDAPANSQRNLVISIGVLILIPIIVDVGSSIMQRRGIELSLSDWMRNLRGKK